jgi:hypothetical protein
VETIENASLIDAGADEINSWALLELFGHSKVAGRLTSRKLGTEIMFQVDVPKGEKEFSHTELYSPKAVFAIKPTTEDWCRQWATYAATEGAHDVLPYVPASRQLEDRRKQEFMVEEEEEI